MMSCLRLLALACLVPGLFACTFARELPGKINGPNGRANFDLASQPILYADSRVRCGEMQVMVKPNINLERKPTALFVPLGVTQEMSDGVKTSQGISRQVWQQFLQRETFSALELADMNPPYRAEMALPLARQMGADLLVGGYVTYYLDGGTTGSTKISVQIEVYDTSNGNMLWSIAHAGMLSYQPGRDFIILEAQNRMPADPMGTVIATVAGEMAELLHMWTEPSAYGQNTRATSRDSAFGRF